MIEKPNSARGVLETYRPITVSTVLYRVFTKIIGARISEWIETHPRERLNSCNLRVPINELMETGFSFDFSTDNGA